MDLFLANEQERGLLWSIRAANSLNNFIVAECGLQEAPIDVRWGYPTPPQPGALRGLPEPT